MTTDLIVTIMATIKDASGLEELTGQMVAAVADKDPATKQYSFSIDPDRKTLFVMERYPDPEAFMAHTQTMGPFAADYFGKVDVTWAAIHTAPGVELPDEFKAALAPFGTKFMTLVGSFESP